MLHGSLPDLLEDHQVPLLLTDLGEHGHLYDLRHLRPERTDGPLALCKLLCFQPAFHGDGTTTDLEERHTILCDDRQSSDRPRRHNIVGVPMRLSPAEFLHPGIRDFYVIEGEAVDRVLQEHRLLAGRFY